MKNKRFLFLLLLLMMVAIGASGQVQCKRALVFGLGQQEDVSWGKINGDKDIDYIVPMLRGAGYSDIVALRNSEATKVAMAEASSVIKGWGSGFNVRIGVHICF